ncbi:MAG: PAS domain-containing protein [bacterium]
MRATTPAEQCRNLYRFTRLVLGEEVSDREIARRWGMDEKNLRELKGGLHVVPKLARLERLAEVLGIHKYFVLEAASGMSADRLYAVLMSGELEEELRVIDGALAGAKSRESERQRVLAALQAAVFLAYRTLEPEDLFPRVSRELKKFDFESHIFFLDQESGSATIRHSSFHPKLLHAAEAMTGLSLGQFRFPLERVPSFRALIEAKRPVYLPDASVLLYQILGERRLRKFIERMQRIFRILEVVLVPITVRGEVTGVLATGKGGSLSDAYLPEMSFFSEQLSYSLENAMVFKQVKESEGRLRTLFDNLPEGVFECDGSGRIVQINPTGADILGFPDPGGPIGLSIQRFHLLTPNARVVRKQVRKSREAMIQNFVGVSVRKDGSPFLADVTVRTRQDRSGAVLSTEGVFRDISQKGI